MPVAVIADAHLGGPGGAPEPLVAQLESLPSEGCERLLVLGDLFQAWVGFPHFESADIPPVVDALRRLRDLGIAVDYVEGNRDFFLAGSCYADAFDRLALEVSFEAGGRRFLAVHGDGLDADDRQYRLWRWLSKSSPSRFFMRTLPSRLARRFLTSTERRLADTNFEHKIRVPEEAIRRFAECRLEGPAEVLLLGHFHVARRWQVAGGEVRLLDAWFHTRRVEWLEG